MILVKKANFLKGTGKKTKSGGFPAILRRYFQFFTQIFDFFF